MSGLIGAMNTALSGLEAFDTGINTVSTNLANQTTAGYAVESVNLTTATEAGQAGGGVQTPQVSRAADGFSASVVRTANSAAAASGTSSTALTALSNALQNNGDVQSALNQFFQDTSSLAANPSSTAQQETVLVDAGTAAGAYQSAAGSLTSVIAGATAGLQQNIGTANNLLSQLAVINQGLGQSPNSPSLLDQQEAALQSLSGIVSINALTQPNGQVLVSSGGTVLLDQSGAQTLSLTGGDVGNPPVITAGPSGANLNAGVADGNIGANIQAWQAGSQALQELNANAAVFAASVNQVQAQGLTVNGAQGANLFSTPAPSVAPASSNTGSAALTAQLSNASQLPTDGGPFLLSYSASSGWSAVDQTSGQSFSPGSGTSLSFAGLSINVTGAAASGDQFVINPAPDAASGIQVVPTNPNAIAAADPYVVSAGALQSDGSIQNSNAGNIVAGADSVTSSPPTNAAVIPSSYYGQTLQINFTTASQYNVVSTSDPSSVIAVGSFTNGQTNVAVAYPAGAAAGQYWQVPLTGSAAAGDSLTVSPGGSSSGSNANRLAALWTSTGTTSSGTLQQSVVNFSTALASNAQQAQQRSSATQAQLTTVSNNLQTIAGVSLDQQAVVLTGYSQAYQAAAQVISTAHTMFESLLQAI